MYSKKDINLIMYAVVPALVWIGFIVSITMYFFYKNIDIGTIYYFFIMGVCLSIGSYLIVFRYMYEINTNFIKVKMGFIVLLKIPISNILKVDKKRKSHKIYGLSRDFISIKTKNNREINISPIDKTEFVNYLTKIDPDIKVEV